jgi:hypothetical protein
MSNLDAGQRWAIVGIVSAILFVGVTFFLQGEVRVFGYVVVALCVGIYAVVNANAGKNKPNA